MWEQTTLQNVAEQYANVLFCIKTYSKMNVDCHVKPKVILKCLPQWMFFPVHYLCKLEFFGREAEKKEKIRIWRIFTDLAKTLISLFDGNKG